VKGALDGIYADMHGFSASDWKTFYAVIFMTDHFFTVEQIEAHTRLAEGRRNWRILPVYGIGKKKPKAKDETGKNGGAKDENKAGDDEGAVDPPKPNPA
jgi:hypothetical protein